MYVPPSAEGGQANPEWLSLSLFGVISIDLSCGQLFDSGDLWVFALIPCGPVVLGDLSDGRETLIFIPKYF